MVQASHKEFRRIVAERQRGKRIDHYLIISGIGISRSLTQKLIDKGQVLVNAHPVKHSYRVKTGDEIYVSFELEPAPQIKAEDIPDIERYSVGLDFGLNMAAVLIGRAGDNIYIVDDMGMYNATASAFNSQMDSRWDYDIVYCDPAGGERIQEIAYGDKANNAVDPGIDYISTAIEQGRFFVCEQAHGVLSEIYDYRRDEKERVIKKNDHYMDAMRYGVFSEVQYGDVFAGYVEI